MQIKLFNISISIAAVFLFLSYFLSYQQFGVVVPLLFWAPLLILFVQCIIAVFFNKKSQTIDFLLPLILLSSCFFLISFLNEPSNNVIVTRDPMYLYQSALNIANTGSWHPGSGTELAIAYSYFPSMQIIMVALSQVLGVNLVLVSKLAPLLHGIIVPIILYFLLKNYIGKKSAAVASLVYIAVPALPIFSNQENMASVFFFLSLYFLQKISTSGKKSYFACFFIFSFAVFSTHAFTSYILISLLITLFLAKYALPIFEKLHLLKKPEPSNLVVTKWYLNNRIGLILLVSIGLWLFWVSSVSLSVAQYQFGEFFKNLFQLFSQPFFQGLPDVVSGNYYSPFERYFTTSTIAIFSLFALVGFVLYGRSKKVNVEFYKQVLYFGAITLLSVVLIFTSYNFILRRIWAFSFIALAPLIALFLIRIIKIPSRRSVGLIKKLCVCLFLVVMLSTEIILIYPPDRNPQLSESIHLPQYTVYAAFWMQDHTNFTSSSMQSLGGPIVYDIFNSFGYIPFDMNYTYVYSVLNKTDLTHQDVGLLTNRGISFVVLAKYYTTFPLGFDEYLTYPPLSTDKLAKFSVDDQFDRVYDNGAIQTFTVK